MTTALLPFAQFALNSPDAAGMLAAINEAGPVNFGPGSVGGMGGGLSFTGQGPAPPLQAAPAQNNLGLALQGVQGMQPPEQRFLPPVGVGVGRFVSDANPLLAMMLAQSGVQPQPNLGQQLLGR